MRPAWECEPSGGCGVLLILKGAGSLRAVAGRCGLWLGAAVAISVAVTGPAWAGPAAGASRTLAKAEAAAVVPIAASRTGCTKRTGRGFAPTDHFARLKAWETVAQASGNWPFQSDEFRSTSYRCRPERNGRLCLVAIEVCRRV